MFNLRSSKTTKKASSDTPSPNKAEELQVTPVRDDIIDDSDEETQDKSSPTLVPKTSTAVATLSTPMSKTVASISLPPKPKAIAKVPPTAAPPSTATAVQAAPVVPQTPAQLSAAEIKLQLALDNWIFNYHDPTSPIDPALLQAPIAAALGTPSTTEQETKCKAFYDFLTANWTDLSILNADTTSYVFAVHIPGTRMLKICYGLGSGVSFGGLGGSTINNYALAISGDHQPGIKFPSVMTFPLNDICDQITIQNPGTYDLFDLNQKLGTQKQPLSKLTFFPSKLATRPRQVLPIAPIPIYMVHDFIDNNMDVMLLIDRLQAVQQHDLEFFKTKCPNVYKHATRYCVNALVTTTKKTNTVGFPLAWYTGQHVDQDAERWKKHRLEQHFPTIFGPAAPPPTATSVTTTTLQSTTKQDDEQAKLLQSLLIKQLQQPQTTKSDEYNDKYLGMSESEYEKLLQLSYIQDGDIDKLPTFWKSMAEKNRSKEGKKSDVRNALRTTKVKFKDAKIKITPSLITMIVARAFEGDVSSSKQAATKGLTPFALPPMSNAELDDINALDSDINAATSVSTSDIKKTKLPLVEVDNYNDLMRYLKEYANLLAVLFTERCPLWCTMDDLIDSLMEYTEEERAALQRASCNAILWIIMRQSRSFAAGEMVEPDDVLPEYGEMMMAITVRRKIEFLGLPPSMKRKPEELLQAEQAKKHRGNGGGGGGGNNNNNNNKKAPPEFTDKGVQHPKLAQAFEVIRTQNRVPPQIFRLCEACDTKHHLLFPNRPGMCAKAQIFGQCPKNCNHTHVRISDNEAEAVIRKLKKALDNPGQFKQQVQ